MIKLSAAEIIQATGGAALGLQDPETVFCTFTTTDSREVVPGTLLLRNREKVPTGTVLLPRLLTLVLL